MDKGIDVSEVFECAVGLFRKGEADRAEEMLREIVAQAPESAEAYHLLGILALKGNRPQEAADFFRQAARFAPGEPKHRYNCAVVLQTLGETADAVVMYEKVLALDPGHAGAKNNLAAALRDAFQLRRAERLLRSALEAEPANTNAWSNLGNVLRDQGRIEEALDAYGRALECDRGNSVAHSNLLLCLHYHPGSDPQAVFEAHREWAAVHCSGIGPFRHLPPEDCSDNRPIRVGYVSADFRTHSVSYFLKPLLLHHDRRLFDVHCYHAGKHEDETTRWFKKLPLVWRDIRCLDDRQAAEQVMLDGVDILIDCSGHTDGNRLKLFALKPSPVQITYLGYPDTTGLSQIDYRLTDAWADPVEAPTPAAEKLIRLPGGFLCYAPPDSAPEVTPLPAERNRYLTFGSSNAVPKLNGAVIALWGRMLSAVPSARLLLKARQFQDPEVSARYLALFNRAGVASERIDIAGYTPGIKDHFQFYNRVDVGLDPFPYNGTTSTLDALFMGVPVITLEGASHAGRVGSSILNHAGLSQFVASSPDRYVETGVFLSKNRDVLAQLRKSLRAAVIRKNDEAGFTRQLEATLRGLWNLYCRK